MLNCSQVELVLDARANLGECPVWDDRSSTLVWVDVMAAAVHQFDPATGRDSAIEVGQPVGAVGLRRSEGLVLALRDGFALLHSDGALEFIADTERDLPDNRMNDGKVDSQGCFWAGTMAFGLSRGAGTLYRLEPGHAVTPMLRGLSLSNGLGWSPDDRTMYLIDSLEQVLMAFDFEAATGALSNRRDLVLFTSAEGLPDGMTVDSEGFLWVAIYGAGAIRRFTPGGALDTVLELPVSQPTCCAFGGEDLGDLYITSASQQKEPADLAKEPSLGGIFRCRPGVAGLPPTRFAG